jgi:hypothetical protein
MTIENQLALLVDKLRLPAGRELEPWLKRLVTEPDSLIIIAIEKPLHADGPRVATGWLSAKERLQVRKALERVNAQRMKANQPTTAELPQ